MRSSQRIGLYAFSKTVQPMSCKDDSEYCLQNKKLPSRSIDILGLDSDPTV